MAVSTTLLDHRLMRLRKKSVYEMKPDILWAATHGIGVADGASFTDWEPRRGGGTATVNFGSPDYLAAGLANRPSVQFDGSTRLLYSGSVLSAEAFTVLMQIQCQTETSAGRRMVFHLDNGTTDRFIAFGVDASGYAQIYSRDTTKAGFYLVSGDTLLGTGARTLLFTANAAGDAWEIYVDGVAQTLTPGANGNPGFGPSDYGATSRAYLGGNDVRFAGQVAYVAGWNQRI